jgi:hypothetical protein
VQLAKAARAIFRHAMSQIAARQFRKARTDGVNRSLRFAGAFQLRRRALLIGGEQRLETVQRAGQAAHFILTR